MEADLGVLGVRDKPVDRGEMLPLCQLLVQPPKHLQRHRDTLKQCVATGNMTWTIQRHPHKSSVWQLEIWTGQHTKTQSRAVCGNWKYDWDNTQRHTLKQCVASTSSVQACVRADKHAAEVSNCFGQAVVLVPRDR